MVSDGRGAGGTGARRAATGGRRRRTDAPPPARPEAELAAAQRETAGLKRQAEDLERRLAAALEQQTATTEVLRAIASNPADLQAVLDAIGDQAVTLCGAEDALIDLVEDAALRPAGHRGVIPAGGMVFDARSGPLLPVARLTRGRVAWRALLDATTVHVPDILAEPPDAYPLSRQTAEQAGHRALLATPLLRDGRPVGVITLRRRTPGRFDAQQVSLLETFAHQAVIAIENARLFRELRDSNRALTEQKQHLQEALEQQTATADILRVIASSPTDLQRVLDAIAERASRLCGAVDTVVYRLEGDALSPVAGILVPRSNPSQAARPGGPMSQPTPTMPMPLDRSIVVGGIVVGSAVPMPLDRSAVVGRAAIDRRTIHIADILAEPDDEYRLARERARVRGNCTMLATPLVREGDVVGVILMRRSEVKPFTEQQVKLLETFADQAVIAIENARLFRELEESNRTLTEALEQQTATAEVLAAISRAPTDLQRVLDTIADSAARLCGADRALIFRVEGDTFRAVAGLTPDDHRLTLESPPELSPVVPLSRARDELGGRAIVAGEVVHLPDLAAVPEAELPAPLPRALGVRSSLTMPLLRQGVAIGAIFLPRQEVRPFTDRETALVQTFADQAVIALENARLFQALQEQLEQQTAAADILRVISSSVASLQMVVDTVVERSCSLCGADNATIRLVEGDLLRVAANHWRALPADAEDQRWLERAVAVGATQRLDQPGSTRAEAFATGRTVYEPDIRVSRGPDHRAARAGLLSVASVPLLREGAPVGVLNVRSFRAHAYSEQHLRLLETFADQAVIAVENARLFRELQERLEQQTASAEILRAISESPTDLQRVLDTIAASAARLCEATDAAIFRVEEGLLRAVARHGPRQRRQQVGVARRIERPLRNPNALPFAVLRERQTIHLADVFATPAWADAGWTASGPVVDAGIRSRLGTPLLREGNAIGVLVVDRVEQRPFTDQQIALLETFVDQAVIAIENARLFAELQESNHTLTEALEQQTATAEVLEAISRAPADLQAVLETLVANAVRLCRADTGLLLRREADGYRVAAEQGMGRPLIDYLAERGLAPGRDTASGRALLERRVVRLADNAAEPGYDPAVLEVSANRSLLAVPLLRDGEPAGVITVGRERVEPFDDRLVGLVQTFADQAVIAIENTRLFQELQESNRTLTEALEQQTATAEVLAAISRAPTDLQQVLDTIADSAARLCGTERAVIVLVEGDAYRSVAGRGGGDRWATLSGQGGAQRSAGPGT